MMNDLSSNLICASSLFLSSRWISENVSFRLRLSLNTDDPSASEVDSFITPSTPVAQSGSFGLIEPTMSVMASDFTIPVSEYKWNQIVELQLPDGKKVRVMKKDF